MSLIIGHWKVWWIKSYAPDDERIKVYRIKIKHKRINFGYILIGWRDLDE